MERDKRLFFEHIHDMDLFSMLIEIAHRIDIDMIARICTIDVDRKHVYNILSGRPNIEKIEFALERAFHEEYRLELHDMTPEVVESQEKMASPMVMR